MNGRTLILVVHEPGCLPVRARVKPRTAAGAGRYPCVGFTLVELLVVLAVIVVLVALSLPGLRGSSERAQAIRLVANQRDSLLLIDAYAHDNAGYFPFWGEEGTMSAPLNWRREALALNWWQQAEYWGMYLQMRGYDGWITLGPDAHATAFDAVDCAGCGQGRSIHLLTTGALATPEFFVPGGEDEREAHVAQRVANVSSPAQKGLLLHLRGLRTGRPAVGFADGHVEEPLFDSLLPGVEMDIPYSPLAVAVTQRGIRGRDRSR